MAQIGIAPIVMRDVVLTIGSDTYEKNISGAEFIPSSGTVQWQGLVPGGGFTFPTDTTWTLRLDYAQDWETTNSLAQYLLANAGTKKTIKLAPKNGGTEYTADVWIAPGPIGGNVNTVAVGSVTLGVEGQPTKVTGG